MTTTPPLLTDEQIEALAQAAITPDWGEWWTDTDAIRRFTKAVRAPLLAKIKQMTARLDAYERELGAVMPADFKDWHQNSLDEHPAVAAGVILNQREHYAWAESVIEGLTAERDALVEQLACVRQAMPEQWRESVPSVAVATLTAERDAAVRDAERYRHMIEASPREEMCFLGESYFGKAALDAAIDIDSAREATNG